MRSTEFIVEGKKKKKEKEVAPRNFVAKNAPKAGAGAHTDKKKADKKGEVKHKKKQFNESFNICETHALIETAMDSIKHPKYGTIWWINHGGVHIIASKSPTGSLEIHALGDHAEIAHKWAHLKSKIHLGTQDINDSMYESATAGATSSGNIGTVPNPHLTVGKTNKSYTGTPGQSGTKRPKQPKMKMQSPGTNALDSSANIFGSGAIKRK